MLDSDDFFAFDEVEEPAALLRALPEIRQNLRPSRQDDELGLRALLEASPANGWDPEPLHAA